MKRRIIAMLLAIVMLVGNVPVQAFATASEPQETTPCPVENCTYGAGHSGECSTFVACTVEGCTFALDHEGNCSNYVASEAPKVEPAADAPVYVTVSNRGELDMAYEEVTVSDLNADGKLSVDEALYAAHTVYGKGYTSQEGTVTQLWSVETSNVSFFVNHAVISMDVNTETISAGDYLVASIDQDAVNDYDKYSRFDVLETSVRAGEAFTLTLTDDAGNALAGMEIGLSNGNGTTTMTGLTTDVNGSVTLTLDQEGLYCVTVKGTVVESSIDVNTLEMTSIETPIIAPVCVVTVSGATEQAAIGWSSTSRVAATNTAVLANASVSELYEIQTGIATVNQNWMDATSIYLDADVVSHTRAEGTNEFTVILAKGTDTTAAIGLEMDLLTYKQNQVAAWNPTVSVNGNAEGSITAAENGVAGTNGTNGAWPAIWSGADVTPAWSNGKADITVALTMGSNTNTYVLHLVIEGNEGPSEVAVESVALDKSEATLEIGETVTLTATVTPEDATNKTVTRCHHPQLLHYPGL